jgi:superfamily II DNA or RNA helicase
MIPMHRKLSPDLDDRTKATTALLKIFKDSEWDFYAHKLHVYLEERSPGIEKIIAGSKSPGSEELPDDDIPQTIVDMFGIELFVGDYGAKFREIILNKLFVRKEYDKIKSIYFAASHNQNLDDERQRFATGNKEKISREYVEELTKNRSTYKWISGKYYAREFVTILRIPEIFAGIPSDPKEERTIEVPPRAKIFPMKNFQKNMKNQVVEILYEKDIEKNRAILTLPTGAGKTRIAVESIVEYLNNEGTDRNILWIAQSQEICEQAVLQFKQIWQEKGQREILNVYRIWDDRELPRDLERGIIVASYQKLRSQKEYINVISDDGQLAGVFIDEAHHAVANSYGEILNGLGMSGYSGGRKENDTIPLIGLTATPERSKSSETKSLKKLFGDRIIYPSSSFEPKSEGNDEFDHSWMNLLNVKQKLTEKKYLAEAHYHEIANRTWKLDQNETKQFEHNDEEWMKKIVTDEYRNNKIITEIEKWAKLGKKILYFGTNVAQSNAISSLLKLKKISSVCITGDTRYAIRKLYIDTFNGTENKIQVICNYNVLSTGFDSPKIDVVIIARPTGSVVSYQQMVGRGLRGEAFGGNVGNKCDIVTVKDNIEKYNKGRFDLGYQIYQKELSTKTESDKTSSGKKIHPKILETDDDSEFTLPVPGETFSDNRKDSELAKKFKFQNSGGIRFTNKHNYVALILREGNRYYRDVEGKSSIIYIGMGNEDQTFTRWPGTANAKVIDPDSILMFFIKDKNSTAVFQYQVKFLDFSYGVEVSSETKKERRVIKFRLEKVKK